MMRSLMKANDTRKPLSRQIKKLIRSNVNNSIAFGSDSVAQLDEIEQDLFIRGGEVSKGLPAFGHNRFFPVTTTKTTLCCLMLLIYDRHYERMLIFFINRFHICSRLRKFAKCQSSDLK